MLSISRLLAGSVTEADALRYKRQSKAMPSHLLHYSEDKKPVVVWTSTRRCNLHCAHCYTDSFDRRYPDELTTDEALAMVDDLAEFGSPVLLISGGEPLTRPDLEVVAAHAISNGMRAVISSNGTLMTPERAEGLAKIGISYVGLSIDGQPDTHDKFRGMRGAFDATMSAVDACREAGIKTGLRFTLTRSNRDDLGWLFDLMVEREVPRLCVYHLAPTGRGAKIGGFTPSSEETRESIDLIFDRTEELTAAGFEPEVLTADNHADAAYLWMRVARTQPERAAEVWKLLQWNGGNQSGQAIACIDSDGKVYPDQFWRWQDLGNIRDRPFSEIWSGDPPDLLRELRQRPDNLPELCKGCGFLTVCNGNFRSRAEATTGDVWGDDPMCYLTPEEVAREVQLVQA
ncbi:MAG: radical SAM protein [Dehalococcoidia bacterium]|jgi:radical SAM protein with 4Fe4S-binding SPASM domain|nr:radical SAM protein [Dehalococcoidia bacterium]